MTAQRDNFGRFQSGQSGNPGGQRKSASIERSLAELVANETPDLLVRAYERAKTDDAVMASLLAFMTAALREPVNVNELHTRISALAVGRQPRH